MIFYDAVSSIIHYHIYQSLCDINLISTLKKKQQFVRSAKIITSFRKAAQGDVFCCDIWLSSIN